MIISNQTMELDCLRLNYINLFKISDLCAFVLVRFCPSGLSSIPLLPRVVNHYLDETYASCDLLDLFCPTISRPEFFYKLIYEPSYCNFPESRKKIKFIF